jgi:hypothetical protein
MKQCSQCRQTYEDKVKFCLTDGTALVHIPEPATSFSLQDAERTGTAGSLQSTTTRWIVAALCSTSLLVIIVGISFFRSSYFAPARLESNPISSEPTANFTNGMTGAATKISPERQFDTNRSTNVAVPPLLSSSDVGHIRQSVTDRITNWQRTSESRDIVAYMQNYGENIRYYRKINATKDFVRNDKERAFTKFDSISLKIDVISINPDSDGLHANAVIDKEFLFQGGGYLAGKVRQLLSLSLVNSDWLITGERDLKVYYLNK